MTDRERRPTNLSVRASIDGVTEILGENTTKMLMRQAGLMHLYENKPDYNFEPCITTEEQVQIYIVISDLLGFKGAMGVWRRIGYTVVKYAHKYGNIFDAFTDLEPDERFARSMEVFVAASGKGRLVYPESGPVEFDAFDCLQCVDFKTDRPMCSPYEGFIQYIADLTYGKNFYRVKETECMACGGETCYFRLEKRE
jgi:predicted hydrocarbon binding protein